MVVYKTLVKELYGVSIHQFVELWLCLFVPLRLFKHNVWIAKVCHKQSTDVKEQTISDSSQSINVNFQPTNETLEAILVFGCIGEVM